MPDDRDAAASWFLETLFVLREELDNEAFEALRAWLVFLTDEQPIAH